MSSPEKFVIPSPAMSQSELLGDSPNPGVGASQEAQEAQHDGPSTSTPHTDGENQAPLEQGPTEEQLKALKTHFKREDQLADLILQMRKKDRMRSPASVRAYRIVEMLEEAYGENYLGVIINDIRTHGKHSQYYKDSLTFFDVLKKVSTKELRDYAYRIVDDKKWN